MSKTGRLNLEVLPLKEKAPLEGATEMDFLIRHHGSRKTD